MVKKEEEKPKKKKKRKKTFFQILAEYVRTISVSFLAALIFTVLLSFHARSEMIKNLYVSAEEQQKINEQLARQIVTQSDFTKDLFSKSYTVCMHVGNLYESASDYQNAQLAYQLALEKAKYKNYAPYYSLSRVLIAQEKFKEASELIDSAKDISDKNLIKFKTRAFIDMGDKYYSIGKFLSSAKSYEKAKFYYDKFSKKDRIISQSIKERIVNAYIDTADVMVRSGLNSDAVRYLHKAEKLDPDDFKIRYKLAIIYSDLDPLKSVEYFAPLLKERPQDIDNNVYSKALLKAANIAEWEGRPEKAKNYRYKIHSTDIFLNNKVVYKDDIEVYLEKFSVNKRLFRYRLKALYKFKNVSYSDMKNLSADFVLRKGDKISETVTVKNVVKTKVLASNGGTSPDVKVIFGKHIFTKKEISQYSIDIYLYKDEKYKTHVSTMRVPLKSVSNINTFDLIPELN